MEYSSTGNPTKRCKGKVVRAFFREAWTTVKSPFIRHDPNSVVCLKPQPDLEDPELMHVSSPVRNMPMPDADPELACLPGQVCEDLASPCVSGSFRIKQKLNTDLVVPQLDDKKAKKGRKRRAVRAFFRGLGKAAKELFLCHKPDSVQHLTPQSDLANSELMLSSEIKSVPEPEPESVPEPEPESVPELESVPEPESGQVCEDLPSSMPVETDDPVPLPVKLQRDSKISDFFLVGNKIGSGAFGQVYEGTYKYFERNKVAIKHICQDLGGSHVYIPGHFGPLLAEVGVMLLLGQAPSCPNVIKLHHWIYDETGYTLIMEKPDPCQTLKDYIKLTDDLNEAKARWLIRQLVRAVKHCVDRGVFHGDIHSRNILVVTDDSLTLKLIDFGNGCLIGNRQRGFVSRNFGGAVLYAPPEVVRDTFYHAKPAYVWAVGVVLFEILHRCIPFKTMEGIKHNEPKIRRSLSSECRDLILGCLSRIVNERLTLEQLEKHSWFDKRDQDVDDVQ